MPFEQLMIFSTNLEPADLVDEAFLRRIPYKIEIGDPVEEEFHQLFELYARRFGCEYRPEVVDYLLETHYVPQRPLRRCHPRDLLDQIGTTAPTTTCRWRCNRVLRPRRAQLLHGGRLPELTSGRMCGRIRAWGCCMGATDLAVDAGHLFDAFGLGGIANQVVLFGQVVVEVVEGDGLVVLDVEEQFPGSLAEGVGHALAAGRGAFLGDLVPGLVEGVLTLLGLHLAGALLGGGKLSARPGAGRRGRGCSGSGACRGPAGRRRGGRGGRGRG